MTRLPAPVLRGLSVLAIGAVLALGHATLASASSVAGVAPAIGTAPSKSVQTERQVTAAMPLPENCYSETEVQQTKDGRTVSVLIQECD